MSGIEAQVISWLALKDQLQHLREELKKCETTIGLDGTRGRGPYDGTNLCEYQCERCKHEWLCGTAIPCPKCHPEAYAAIQRYTQPKPQGDRT